MKLQNRIEILLQLKEYLEAGSPAWKSAKEKASINNAWFTPEFIELAVHNIASQFLERDKLLQWIDHYRLDDNILPKNVGIVMAGNIPLVGFHDFLCVFVSGHRQTIKLSSKDEVLLKHLVEVMSGWQPAMRELVSFAPMLKGCDAYIATGSNNSGRYFDYYFSKYPSIIRRNRTSVAVLTGDEKMEELENLSDDIHVFFGLGCRNVTKLFIPEGYDFVPLLQSFHKYRYFADHHKFRNNYDYHLSVLIMNNRFYMTDESILLVENESFFSPISVLNYSFYNKNAPAFDKLKDSKEVQCIVGLEVPLGVTQRPELDDYADGIDTMEFLLTL